jgi:intraflagellar transport protein 74
LTKEVRELEGQLADYNLAFDKWRANTRPEDISNIYERIKVMYYLT